MYKTESYELQKKQHKEQTVCLFLEMVCISLQRTQTDMLANLQTNTRHNGIWYEVKRLRMQGYQRDDYHCHMNSPVRFFKPCRLGNMLKSSEKLCQQRLYMYIVIYQLAHSINSIY